MSVLVDKIAHITKDEIENRPDLFYNLGGMMACVLYTRGGEDYPWLSPFIDGINSFTDEISRTHVAKDPIIVAFQNPDVAQA